MPVTSRCACRAAPVVPARLEPGHALRSEWNRDRELGRSPSAGAAGLCAFAGDDNAPGGRPTTCCPWMRPSRPPPSSRSAVAVLLSWQIYQITLSPRPGLKAMEAMAITVPLFVLLYAAACFLMEHSAPGSFSEPLSRTDALYFAMTVFSTVGFGDITARSEPARLLTTGQITLNLLLLGVAARLLANAVQRGRHRRGPTRATARAVPGRSVRGQAPSGAPIRRTMERLGLIFLASGMPIGSGHGGRYCCDVWPQWGR
ncbi:potassium channel family protein [Streptomyces sp. NBC_01278]|uniref:potassium channel family protein n=1 Tax=Streptomyces sp. NBC_01278 TaxID=2903809 RepID=UPI002E37E285|nr:potassium channel family protein [Streptomyces sp. NBC_01278]